MLVRMFHTFFSLATLCVFAFSMHFYIQNKPKKRDVFYLIAICIPARHSDRYRPRTQSDYILHTNFQLSLNLYAHFSGAAVDIGAMIIAMDDISKSQSMMVFIFHIQRACFYRGS